MNNLVKCCLCGKVVEGFNDNPHPENKDDKKIICYFYVCDDCDSSIVMPAREAMFNKKGE